MAKPPLPLDALSLVFAASEFGGLEKCAVFMPGVVSHAGQRPLSSPPLGRSNRSIWVDVPHLKIAVDAPPWGFKMAEGAEAAKAIAARRTRMSRPRQILRVAPIGRHKCECDRCEYTRTGRLEDWDR